MNCTPKVRQKTFGVQFNYEAFIKREITNYSAFDRGRAKPLSQAVVRMLFAYRKYLKTITTDNGSEFAAHLDITAGLRMKGLDDVTVYFADSYCSWQKGAVENVNKLIRQYIPKKSNFNDFSDNYIKNLAKKLNLRPRKKLSFSNPKTEFFKQIANFALAS